MITHPFGLDLNSKIAGYVRNRPAMLQWLTGRKTVTHFSGDLSVFQGGPLGEIQRLVEPFETLLTTPGRSERDVTETLETCAEQLDWLATLAARSKPFRNAAYTWNGIAAVEKLWRICGDLQSPQLDDLAAVCSSLFQRAPWYPNPTRKRRWFDA